MSRYRFDLELLTVVSHLAGLDTSMAPHYHLPMPKPQRTTDQPFRYNIRVDAATHRFIEEQAKAGAFKSGHEYVRWLLRRARAGDSAAEDMQAIILNSLANTDQEIDMLRQQTNALFSLVQASVRQLLSCLPELPSDQRRMIAATVNKRFDHILQAVAKDFRSGSSSTLEGAMESGKH